MRVKRSGFRVQGSGLKGFRVRVRVRARVRVRVRVQGTGSRFKR